MSVAASIPAVRTSNWDWLYNWAFWLFICILILLWPLVAIGGLFWTAWDSAKNSEPAYKTLPFWAVATAAYTAFADNGLAWYFSGLLPWWATCILASPYLAGIIALAVFAVLLGIISYGINYENDYED